MGRPEKPVEGDGAVARLARELRAERQRAKPPPTYKEMAARVHLSPAALSTAANGQSVATWEVVRRYLMALTPAPSTMRHSPAEMDNWHLKWEAAKAEEDRQKREKKEERIKEAARLNDERTITAYSKQTLPYVHNRLLVDQIDHGQVVQASAEPDPDTLDTSEQFVAGLRQLRIYYSVSLRDLAQRIRLNLPSLGYRVSAGQPRPLVARSDVVRLANISHATIHKTLSSDQMPNLAFVFAYLNACGCDQEKIRRWANARQRIRHVEKAREAMQQAMLQLSRQEDLARRLPVPDLAPVAPKPAPPAPVVTPPRPTAAVAVSIRRSYRARHANKKSEQRYRMALAGLIAAVTAVLTYLVVVVLMPTWWGS